MLPRPILIPTLSPRQVQVPRPPVGTIGVVAGVAAGAAGLNRPIQLLLLPLLLLPLPPLPLGLLALSRLLRLLLAHRRPAPPQLLLLRPGRLPAVPRHLVALFPAMHKPSSISTTTTVPTTLPMPWYGTTTWRALLRQSARLVSMLTTRKSDRHLHGPHLLIHDSQAGGGGYGQNIGAGASPDAVPALITNEMYDDEIPFFPLPYGQASPDMSNFENWGHFSQIVWQSTTSVGCATVDCSASGLANTGSDVSPWFTVCNYSPPGRLTPSSGADHYIADQCY